ncbi:MAG: imidazole glycerol phosphate synthase subunit HisH [Acidimicrobiales bacterium]
MIAVLDYGIGNLASAQKALAHLGAPSELVSDPALASGADAVVLPGVGAFGPAMKALRRRGLDQVALDVVERGGAFLGICVGMQMLYAGSEENPDVPGLGMLPGKVTALPPGPKAPQMQWNILTPTGRPSRAMVGLDPDPWAYFVHSYAAPIDSSTTATCEYGGPVCALVERGNLWATQFHPEKSGPVGMQILHNFVKLAASIRVTGTPTSSSR